MRNWYLAVILIAVAVAAPLTLAQRPASGGAPAHSVTARPAIQAPHVVHSAPSTSQRGRVQSRSNLQTQRTRRDYNNRFACNGASNPAVQQVLNPYPTNGFTFQHEQNVQGNILTKATIDPATQQRLSAAQRFGCETFGAGGYYLLGGGYGYALPQDQGQGDDAAADLQQANDVAQQPAEQAYYPQDESIDSEAPVKDEGQFTLVLLNGTQIEAVAFMRDKDVVTYITPEGIRKAMSLASLDVNATVQINQERGTPLKLPL